MMMLEDYGELIKESARNNLERIFRERGREIVEEAIDDLLSRTGMQLLKRGRDIIVEIKIEGSNCKNKKENYGNEGTA